MEPFVHLHVHSQYSILDGQASIEALVNKAIEDGMPGIALTDHGVMYGVKEMFNYVSSINNDRKKKGLEAFVPIYGCEVYVAASDKETHVDKEDRGSHLILLAKNKKGYQNLIKIVSRAWKDGFYMHPRTDHADLEKYHEGIIACSACLAGEVPRLIRKGDLKGAEERILWYKSIFGDDYYLELQRHKATTPRANHEAYREQERVNPVLIELSKKHGIKLVATNDVHFVNEDDAEAHDRLICISTNKNVADDDRMFYSKQEWLKTTEEMNRVFNDVPEALRNTREVLDKIEIYTINHEPIMPTFEIPAEFGTEEEYRSRITEKELFDEFTRDENGNVVLSEEEAHEKIKHLGGYDKLYRIKFEADYLRKLAYEGAHRRYGQELSSEIEERINFELHIMKTMGFPGYFLIVQDFINESRDKLGVSVGPGRGSAAGSCVAYCLGITQIDPLKYDLLFERFLNPDRISLPDIDIDFDDDGRAKVLKYVTDKYGEEKVAHIITYGTMAAKSAIKDVARTEQLPLPESNRLANLVPDYMPEVNGKKLKTTLDNCYKHVPDFKKELSGSDPLIVETLEYARKLEGNVRNVGVHACGVIICRDDITDWVPVSTATDKVEGKLLVTQFEGKVIEETGLIKMDFLGLKTLSIIKDAIENIRLTRDQVIDIENIPLDDPLTFKLYCQGKTTGTFQFESSGMQRYLKELKPSTFEDLIAMNALYRPGPMDYIPQFINRKHGVEEITYDIPIMERYLKDTYGITVYQEQVMLLSRLLANFTRGESDTLRKAMGKKQIDKMAKLKNKFIAGGNANGHETATLEKIWSDWEKFASYAFNKSHATCYSWVAYQTAWLKANYTPEFMAAVLSRNRNDISKLRMFMDECKSLKIPVLGPNVNESFSEFGVNRKGEIRFGLSAIKGVGESLVKGIIEERNNGPFSSIYDFVERVPLKGLNSRVMECLALAGAFDCFEDVKREDYFETNTKGETFIDQLLRYGNAYRNAREAQANSLFDIFGDSSIPVAGRPQVKPAISWPDVIKLEKEKEYVGMYLSANPLDPYYMDIVYGLGSIARSLENPIENKVVKFAGMVVEFEKRIGKNGNYWGRMKIEDFESSTTIFLFGNEFQKFQNFGEPGTAIYVTGMWRKNPKTGEWRLTPTNMQLLSDVKGTIIKGITLHVTPERMNKDFKNILGEAVSDKENKHNGFWRFRVFDPVSGKTIQFTSRRNYPITRKMLSTLEDMEIPFRIDN
ncbi:MAG: DNA polymerase III subunit alpha [Muribaculaceae bacterium]|nr:DNA polymerase III subunit alpha [Muribaculaceae bacterium]